ncbi:hypothetical protein TBR22_A17830 [Luteitalea sp. TBR-22]|uniref:porin family protein n=1 Tax=Luteitalea sp. TBR-22 TaxID=2802971 RepID=UPI001AF3BE60|nr:porin family protein [Luteitalea sp. TBR-22]BCS32569.1 hypothetical protein TBR22_A17830 [Luteitalea sp. TBR-22]
MQRVEWVRRVVIGVMFVVAATVPDAVAQTSVPRVEVGGLVSALALAEAPDTSVGVGGRLTVNLTRWLGLEGEYQFVPDDEFTLSSVQADGRTAGLRYERRRSTALFGVKAGYRGDRIGLFARVRPGVTSLTDRGVDCLGDVCALLLLAVPEYRPEFALDIGGVVELYPSSRWLVRADLGVLRVWHRGSAPPCGSACATSSFGSSIGVGVRF